MWKGKLWLSSNKALLDAAFYLLYESKTSCVLIPPKTAVRLVNSLNLPHFGRVEVRYSGIWGTICDNLWDIQDAEVVCRQLGFDGALFAPRNALYGRGKGQRWLDDVKCGGTEISISDCHHSGWGVYNCRYSGDAGVVCRPTGKVVIDSHYRS